MARILIVDDEQSICWALSRLAVEEGHTARVASSAEQAYTLAAAHGCDVILLDVRLPGADGLSAMSRLKSLAPAARIIVMTAFGDLSTAVTAVRNGAFEYLTKPFDIGHAAAIIDRALAKTPPTARAMAEPVAPDELIGRGAAIQEVFKRIALAAPTNAAVLITGESGTGKELVARAIHRHSPRADGPLLSVNLAALNPSLAESELFGHVQGAFTGADSARRGALEMANGGTLFLDEIGDVPLPMQVKLLRALEQGEVVPVGDMRPRRTAFRLLAATHRNLREEIARGRFREDLFFRLAVFEIRLPPLRERCEDIPTLAEHFLTTTRAPGQRAAFSKTALTELSCRRWPGNVRELRNAVEHGALMARGGLILPEHLPPPAASSAASAAELDLAVTRWTTERIGGSAAPTNLYHQFLAEAEPALFEAVLARTGNNRMAAAKVLGIDRATLRKKINDAPHE